MSFWLLSEKFLYLQCGNFQWSHNFKTYKLNRYLNHHLGNVTSYNNQIESRAIRRGLSHI